MHRPFVSPAGGHEILAALSVALKGPYASVGIVLDADARPQERWAKVRAAAQKSGRELPPAPQAGGVIIEAPGSKRVGVWMMPDNSLAGELEDFLRELVPQGDACWVRANVAVGDALQAGCGNEADRSKHLLYTWLAWKQPPGLPFGKAIKARILGMDGPLALSFVDWFKRLFPAEPV